MVRFVGIVVQSSHTRTMWCLHGERYSMKKVRITIIVWLVVLEKERIDFNVRKRPNIVSGIRLNQQTHRH